MNSTFLEAFKSGLVSSVECEIKKDENDLNTSFIDENGNEIFPITWCCKKEILSLVELCAKRGADPNRTFITNTGEKISVIDWACGQNIGSLIDILLQKGAKASINTFSIAQANKDYRTLESLSSQVKNVCDELFNSKIYQAFDEQKMIDFHSEKEDKEVYIFAFNVGQANFIVIRRENLGVIVDCGESASELMKTFRNSNKPIKKIIEQCDLLVQKYTEFKEHPGRVKKPFSTASRIDPPQTFKNLKELCRSINEDVTNYLLEIQDKTVQDEAFILEHIENLKQFLIQLDAEQDKHILRKIFTEDFSIEAVFLTHSHIDHYSLLIELYQQFPSCFLSTKYYLGGIEEDWKGEAPSRLFQTLTGKPNRKSPRSKGKSKQPKQETVESEQNEQQQTDNEAQTQQTVEEHQGNDKIIFVGRSYESFELNLLGDIRFKLWGRTEPENPDDKNQNSLIITMYYNNQIVLFTGDAEGNVLERLNVDIPSLDDSIEFKEEFQQILDEIWAYIKEKRLLKPKENILIPIQQDLEAFFTKNKIEKTEQMQIYQQILDEMLSIEHSFLVFEPHHGSLTEDSHEIYNYLAAQDVKQIFVISSFPCSKDFLPKEESVMNRENKNIQTLNHPIVYATNGNIATISMTTDPVYTTGSAGDNAYVFKLEQSKVSLLNLYDLTPSWEIFETN